MKILMSAYACEPNKGSEPGAGWNWALAAARNHEVLVLTRANNRVTIEAELACSPQPSLRFRYLDLPPRVRRWKRGERGVRLYYTLWQALVLREVWRLRREHDFDVVHHVTFASLWLPALACLLDRPFVFGPVGGGPRVPLRLYPVLGVRGAGREVLLLLYRSVARWNPFVRLAWRRADVIVVQNTETLQQLPRRHRQRAVIRPHASALCRRAIPQRPPGETWTAVSAGRLLPWKGLALAVEALVEAPDWHLLIVGSGPDAPRLRRLAERFGVAGRVRFVPWLPQEELWREVAACQAFVLPSLRDDAPLTCVEAESIGVPVVALDQGGASVLGRFAGARFVLVPRRSRRECIEGLTEALRQLQTRGLEAPGADFGLDGVERDLESIYGRALNSTDPSSIEAVNS